MVAMIKGELAERTLVDEAKFTRHPKTKQIMNKYMEKVFRFDYDKRAIVKVSDDEIIRLINEHFDLRPAAIIQSLNLCRPIFQPTAAFGHFGRTDIDAPWEALDKVPMLRKGIGANVETSSEAHS